MKLSILWAVLNYSSWIFDFETVPTIFWTTTEVNHTYYVRVAMLVNIFCETIVDL